MESYKASDILNSISLKNGVDRIHAIYIINNITGPPDPVLIHTRKLKFDIGQNTMG